MPESSPPPAGGHVDLPGRGGAWVWDTGGPGPTVLLVHGWTSTAALTWCRCFPVLGESYRVVAMDLRGHGRGIRSPDPFQLEDCADDLAALIDHLALGPVVAVGYSMGGPVVQLLVRRHPGQVAGLVLGATAATFTGAQTATTAMNALGVGALLATTAIPAALRRQGLQRLARRRWERTGLVPWTTEELEPGDLAAYVQAGVAISRYDASDWIASLHVPIVAIITRADTTVAPERQRAMAGAIPDIGIIEIEADHDACADPAGVFVHALAQACAAVTAGR